MTAEEFYGSGKWQRLRAAILRRDKYQCQMCKRYGRIKEAKDVHHIKFLEDHPELAPDPDNLISLCRSCHREIHDGEQEKKFYKGPRGQKF